MGKRKSRAKPAPRKVKPKPDTAFTCPFCNHDESVECTFDMKQKTGVATSHVCNESYATSINYLTEAIDIYTKWLESHSKDSCGSGESSYRRSFLI